VKGSPKTVGPDWSFHVLICPRCAGSLETVDGDLVCARCGRVGRWDDGIARFGAAADDPSTAWFNEKGGSAFTERAQIPFTMSSLDTPVYHALIDALRPESLDALIVDVGCGDGRNTEPWLRWGYRRVVAVDAAFASLQRLRRRIRAERPDALDRLLLIECDSRRIPLATACASRLLAVEVLYYLNDDYDRGLAECTRLVGAGGRILVSERAWEGALLAILLYGGIARLAEAGDARELPDGFDYKPVVTRTFTRDTLLAAVEKAGLVPLEIRGLSALAMVIGYLRGAHRIDERDRVHLEAIVELLKKLSASGAMNRAHVVIAGVRVPATH
jgi:SAM-dependent methyltransferase